MPALLPVPGVCRVVMSQQWSELTCANVFHVQKVAAGAWSQAEVDELANKMATAWTGTLNTLQHSDCVLKEVVTQALDSDTSPSGTWAATVAGTQGGQQYPANVALGISWKINKHYRGGHPRSYIAAQITGNSVTRRTWTDTWVNNAKTKAAAWVAAVDAITVSGNSINPVCVHRERAKAVLNPPQVSVIVGVDVDLRIDSQRRRLGPDL